VAGRLGSRHFVPESTRRFSALLRRLAFTYRAGFALIALVTAVSYLATSYFLDHVAAASGGPAGHALAREIALVRKAALGGAVTILVVLLVEASLVFRPAIRRLQRERDARERMAALRDTAVVAARAADARLAESEMRFRSSFESAAVGMALVDFSGRLFAVNPSLREMLGYTEAELTGLDERHLTHPDDAEGGAERLAQLARGDLRSFRLEKRYLHKDGHVVWALLTMGAVRDADDRPLYGVAQIEDVTGRKRAEEDAARYEAELRTLALTDELTGAHNRRGFRMLADQICRAQHRSSAPLMLVAVDLDRLKQINDQWGHAAGDRALRLVARALAATFRESDVIGRMGGDEFLCLLPDATGFDDRQIRDRLSRSLAALAEKGQEPFLVTATIGTAVAAPMTPTDLETLIRDADASLYARKQQHGESSAVLGPAANGQ
jgi:diguanylate cyclase (GGDEF)-like protein/PAS domain S-box-containing protein